MGELRGSTNLLGEFDKNFIEFDYIWDKKDYVKGIFDARVDDGMGYLNFFCYKEAWSLRRWNLCILKESFQW